MPTVPALALVPPGARLVVVAPHPDDELLACGGLIATRLAAGADALLIVAVSDGEASHRGTPDVAAHRLARCRRRERRDGLQRLARAVRAGGATSGATSGDPAAPALHRLGWPDGQLAVRVQRLASRLQRWLRPTDRVVTTWRGDGHPDHAATAIACARACAAVGCTLLEAPVWGWHWGAPDDARWPWARLVAVPLAPMLQTTKARVLRAHRSQCSARRVGGPVLTATTLHRADRAAEYFIVPEAFVPEPLVPERECVRGG